MPAFSVAQLHYIYFNLQEHPNLPSIANRWVQFAADRSFVSLNMHGDYNDSDDFNDLVNTPPSLLHCHSLHTLQLDFFSISIHPTDAFPGFVYLKDVSLHNVSITDEALSALLSACPVIKALSLHSCSLLENPVISSQTLESMEVYECGTTHNILNLEISDAPKLSCVKICTDLSVVECLKDGTPKLEKAFLFSLVTPVTFENRLCWWQFILNISHVQILFVNYWFFQFFLSKDRDNDCTPSMFPNLKELHICAEPFNLTSLCGLVTSFKDFPSLERLWIHRKYFRHSSAAEVEEYEVDNDDDYGLSQLKFVGISNFAGDEEEIKLEEFAVKNAISLESVVLYCAKEMERKKLDEFRKKMQPCPRASALVCISLYEHDPKYVFPQYDWWT